MSTSSGVTRMTPGSGFSGSSLSASPRPDSCWNSSSACSRLIQSASATSGIPATWSRSRSPVAASTSSCMNSEICAARCQEPPSRSTLSSSSASPMGRLSATAITRQVKKLPIGCLSRRPTLSTRLARWLSSQAWNSVLKSGSSPRGCSGFFTEPPTRSAVLGLVLALRSLLISWPLRHRSGDHAAGSACDGASVQSAPGRGWRSARLYPDG